MNPLFAETLRNLRTKKGLSQNQLARLMFVNNTTISKWENGIHLPDVAMITRLARILEVDVGTLFSTASKSDESPKIIMVEDNKPILNYNLKILEEVSIQQETLLLIAELLLPKIQQNIMAVELQTLVEPSL